MALTEDTGSVFIIRDPFFPIVTATPKFLLTLLRVSTTLAAMALFKSLVAPILEPTLREVYNHAYGKHSAFTGHKYRRGKNRCKHCGAPLDAKAGGYSSMFAPLFKN